MRGLVFWLVVLLAVGAGSWLYIQQERKEEMLPQGSKLLAEGIFTAPVGGVAKVYHLPDGQGRIVFERLNIDKDQKLEVMLSHNPDAADFTMGAVNLGTVQDVRIQALDIPAAARNISYSNLVLVRTDLKAVWAKTKLERAY